MYFGSELRWAINYMYVVYVPMYASKHMYARVYACMHAYMHGRMNACMYACMHACMHACIHACMHVRTLVHIHVRTFEIARIKLSRLVFQYFVSPVFWLGSPASSLARLSSLTEILQIKLLCCIVGRVQQLFHVVQSDGLSGTALRTRDP